MDKCKLTEKEKIVIFYRYGFYNGIIYTYEYIGKKLDVSRETIRNYETKALTKLRKGKIKMIS